MMCDQEFTNSKRGCDNEKAYKRRANKPLSILLLDCWQREYDKRPYKHFQISKTFFEERMARTFSEQDWMVLIDYLEKRKPESIKICNIEIPDAISIQQFVKGFENAKTIQLQNVLLSVNFLSCLQKNITLSKTRKLDLSQNKLTSNHLILLRCILIQSDTLELLKVDNCSINENIFPILADGIQKSRSIRGVDISRPCPISPVSIFDSAKYINMVAQLIWQNKLTSLVLRQSNIDGHDMEILAEYLATQSSQLTHLDLQANNIASHGTELLFTALSKNKYLRSLNLSANNLRSKGGLVLARLISNSYLESLDITHNQIEKEEMFDLLCGIKKPCQLKILNMYGNKFNAKTAALLKRLLRSKVFHQNDIDVTYTWDHSKNELYVVPRFNFGRIRI